MLPEDPSTRFLQEAPAREAQVQSPPLPRPAPPPLTQPPPPGFSRPGSMPGCDQVPGSQTHTVKLCARPCQDLPGASHTPSGPRSPLLHWFSSQLQCLPDLSHEKGRRGAGRTPGTLFGEELPRELPLSLWNPRSQGGTLSVSGPRLRGG